MFGGGNKTKVDVISPSKLEEKSNAPDPRPNKDKQLTDAVDTSPNNGHYKVSNKYWTLTHIYLTEIRHSSTSVISLR